MSLLLDALKKAEQSKREYGAAVPPPAPAERGFPEISMPEPEPPPQAAARVPPRAPQSVATAKTEPVLSLDLPEPPSPPPRMAPRPTSSAPPPTEPAGNISTSQEAAKNILAAKHGPPKRNLKLLGGLLFVAMAAGAGGYVYWQTLSQPARAPAEANFPRRQATLPPASAPPPSQASIATAADTPAPAEPLAKETGEIGTEAMLPVPQNTAISRKTARKPLIPAKTGEAAQENPASAVRIGRAATRELPPEHKEAAPPAAPAPLVAGAVSASGAPGSGIRIRRDAGEPRLDPLLNSAYQSFMAGDSAKAETDYRKVLQQNPNNRDALLGLAAIAASSGQSQQAAAHYLRLLQLDPKDAAAHAGLIGLRGDSDPNLSESRLKTLLAQHPDAAGFLHFALGNLYAQQSRWPEAQEAYFNALHNDAGNADFAFNLAVSLDHLDQRKPALTYYQRALALVKERAAGFDGELLKKRIHELQAPN